MLKTNTITKKQKDILYYLYKFYFLNTNQLQKLCHHKNPQTVQKWLKDLKDKNYINAYDFKENKIDFSTTSTINLILRKLSDTEIDNFVKNNPVLDWAMGIVFLNDDYQMTFVKKIEGQITTLHGLPTDILIECLNKSGVEIKGTNI